MSITRLKMAGWHNHFTVTVTNSQSDIKVSILPEGSENHFKTKSVAFGSRASNASESSSIPKRSEMVEGPRVITRVR